MEYLKDNRWAPTIVILLILASLFFTTISGMIYLYFGYSDERINLLNNDDYVLLQDINSISLIFAGASSGMVFPLLMIGLHRKMNFVSQMPESTLVMSVIIYIIGLAVSQMNYVVRKLELFNDIFGIYRSYFFTVILGTLIMLVAMLIIFFSIMKNWPTPIPQSISPQFRPQQPPYNQPPQDGQPGGHHDEPPAESQYGQEPPVQI